MIPSQIAQKKFIIKINQTISEQNLRNMKTMLDQNIMKLFPVMKKSNIATQLQNLSNLLRIQKKQLVYKVTIAMQKN